MKKLFCLILACCLLFSLVSCSANTPEPAETTKAPVTTEQPETESHRTDDIVVLFTNDVHCNIDGNIGYSGLSAYKESTAEKTPYLTLVDCGDAVQGSYTGIVTKGELPIRIMNEVGYDLAVIGNHEFDYGMDRLYELLEMADAEYLCCNVTYTGSGKTPLSLTKPYRILDYADTKVAYIGVTTPHAIQSSTPVHFQEDGEFVYDFCGESGEALYKKVQENIDACRAEGADYVLLLTHMGVASADSPFTSYELAQNTSGADVILDAHSHTEIPTRVEQNLNGEDVLIAQTGTELNNIGQLVISPNGFITIGYVSDYNVKDEEIDRFIESENKETEELMKTVVGTLDHDMKITDDAGIRMIRNREMAVGNFVADAYRTMTGADIGYTNGGGVRADLLAGDITYAGLIGVNPFGNSICSAEVTGQEVLDMLEYFYSTVEAEYEKDGEAFGENPSFGQISGLRCTVHTDIPTSIETDAEDMLVQVGETRRVSDVEILQGDQYVPIDPDAVYTFASTDYTIKDGGSGMGLLLTDNRIVLDNIGMDYQILIDYTQSLNSDFSAYMGPEGRINLVP